MEFWATAPGEFQHWYERLLERTRSPRKSKVALNPLYCDSEGVCGSVLGMGKVNSSASMQAILLDPEYDFSDTYLIRSQA